MKKEILITTLSFLLLGGCSSKENYYQLHVEQDNNINHSKTHKGKYIGIAEVEIAEYLKKPELITRVSLGRTILHDKDLWTESFEKNIQSVLQYNFSMYAPKYRFISYPWEEPINDSYRIYLTVDKFEGDTNGVVTLDGRWSLVNKNQDKVIFSESIHDRQQGKNTLEGIVNTQSALLNILSQHIINKIDSRI